MGGGSDLRTNLSSTVYRSAQLGTPIFGVRILVPDERLRFPGRLATQKGVTNLGFRDQRLALHWIQENIAAVGCDPTKVAI
jgi:triacylglycerol lipase